MVNVAVVTGANKGIGFGIVENLAKSLSTWKIYLTSRNVELGQASLNKFHQSGLKNVFYHQLDINDEESRNKIVAYFKSNYPQGLKIWINNAGIAFKNDATEPMGVQAEVTNATNYFATVKMMQQVLPIMSDKSNFVNVSSLCGLWALQKLSPAKYDELMAVNCLEKLDQLAAQFNQHAKDEKLVENGWANTAYGSSKMFLTKAVFILGEMYKSDPRQVLISSCCPGYVDTDMSSHKGPLTIQEGSITPVYCAMLRDLAHQGGFFSNCAPLSWDNKTKGEIVLSDNLAKRPHIAVVTGSNKGIGFALVKHMASNLPPNDWIIYLTSRNEALGKEACAKLSQYPNIRYHQLDITKPDSRKNIIAHLRENYPQGVKIWVNNAAICYKKADQTPFDVQAETTLATNYFDTLAMSLEIEPLLAQESNLVNVSSFGSIMALKGVSEARSQQVMDLSTVEQVNEFAHQFIRDAKSGDIAKNGWYDNAYATSKMLLTKATMNLGKSLENDQRRVIAVSCCPGWVDTDLSSHLGPLTIEQGALTPFICATTRDLSHQGCFFNEKRKIDWCRSTNEQLVKQL